MMQERQRFNTIYNDLLVTLDQHMLCGLDRGLLRKRILFEIPVDQISYIKLRKRFIWFGSQGFEINYRRQPKGALFGAFFASNQIKAWSDRLVQLASKLSIEQFLNAVRSLDKNNARNNKPNTFSSQANNQIRSKWLSD